MPSFESELSRSLVRLGSADWLEGLGLDSSTVRAILGSGPNEKEMAWCFERISFEAAEDLFIDCLRALAHNGALERLQKCEKYIEESKWRQILMDNKVCCAPNNGSPALLDWLEAKGVGADFWRENFKNSYLRSFRNIASAKWLLQKGVPIPDSMHEAIFCKCISANDVEFLHKLKESGNLRPTEYVVMLLFGGDADTSRIAAVLGLSLTDLPPHLLRYALECMRSNVLKWLVEEQITPQQCRDAGGDALVEALIHEYVDYLEWLWNVGLTLDEFVYGALRYAPRETHPKVHAWLEQKRQN